MKKGRTARVAVHVTLVVAATSALAGCGGSAGGDPKAFCDRARDLQRGAVTQLGVQEALSVLANLRQSAPGGVRHDVTVMVDTVRQAAKTGQAPSGAQRAELDRATNAFRAYAKKHCGIDFTPTTVTTPGAPSTTR